MWFRGPPGSSLHGSPEPATRPHGGLEERVVHIGHVLELLTEDLPVESLGPCQVGRGQVDVHEASKVGCFLRHAQPPRGRPRKRPGELKDCLGMVSLSMSTEALNLSKEGGVAVTSSVLSAGRITKHRRYWLVDLRRARPLCRCGSWRLFRHREEGYDHENLGHKYDNDSHYYHNQDCANEIQQTCRTEHPDVQS